MALQLHAGEEATPLPLKASQILKEGTEWGRVRMDLTIELHIYCLKFLRYGLKSIVVKLPYECKLADKGWTFFTLMLAIEEATEGLPLAA